jgi:hypothetical protein
MLQVFVQIVSSVFKRFYLDVAYVSHMLQEYVPMVSVVSVLCCSKCYHVACCNCKCFIRMLHMFDTHVSSYVPNVSYSSNICAFKCFMFQMSV